MEYGGCEQLAEALDAEVPRCCGSCHDDEMGGYRDLQEFEHEGKWYRTCCAFVEIVNPERYQKRPDNAET